MTIITYDVKVITNSSENLVAEISKPDSHSHNQLRVYTTATPEKGKANKKVIELIAEHMNVPKSSVIIVRGDTSNKKLIRIFN